MTLTQEMLAVELSKSVPDLHMEGQKFSMQGKNGQKTLVSFSNEAQQ